MFGGEGRRAGGLTLAGFALSFDIAGQFSVAVFAHGGAAQAGVFSGHTDALLMPFQMIAQGPHFMVFEHTTLLYQHGG